MAVDLLDELEEIAQRQQEAQVTNTQQMCRVTLALNAPRPIEVKWNPGKGGQRFYKLLKPGESMIWPLDKAMAEFGPFGVLEEYSHCTDDTRKGKLRDFWVEEKRRALDRFDYPRATLHDRTPTGPHRFPDLTMTVLDADGETEHTPIRLHKIYKIGEFDPIKDSFGNIETAEQVKARYERELELTKGEYLRKAADLQNELKELKGMLRGYMAGKETAAEDARNAKASAKAAAAEEPVPA